MQKIRRRAFLTTVAAAGLVALSPQPARADPPPIEFPVAGPAVDRTTDGQVLIGTPVEFSFWDRVGDVTAFRYRFRPWQPSGGVVVPQGPAGPYPPAPPASPEPGHDWLTVVAHDGPATVRETPTVAGTWRLDVTGVGADSTESPTTSVLLPVVDPRPQVRTSFTDGGSTGLDGYFDFSSDLDDVDRFAYRIDDGPELVLDARYGRAFLDWTADAAGRHVITVHSLTTTGIASPPAEVVFTVRPADG